MAYQTGDTILDDEYNLFISGSSATQYGINHIMGTGKAGDRVVSAGNGEARVADLDECTAFNTLGRLIKDKYNKETALTECVIGVK